MMLYVIAACVFLPLTCVNLWLLFQMRRSSAARIIDLESLLSRFEKHGAAHWSHQLKRDIGIVDTRERQASHAGRQPVMREYAHGARSNWY